MMTAVVSLAINRCHDSRVTAFPVVLAQDHVVVVSIRAVILVRASRMDRLLHQVLQAAGPL